MCDCRLSRRELLTEKANRIQDFNPNEDTRDSNLKRLCPHPSSNSNFLVFCSISSSQASALIQAAETKSISNEDELQKLFAESCCPRWFCSECRHPLANHSSGGIVIENNTSARSYEEDTVGTLAQKLEELLSVNNEEMKKLLTFCGGGECGTATAANVNQIAMAAKAGWELQKIVDDIVAKNQKPEEDASGKDVVNKSDDLKEDIVNHDGDDKIKEDPQEEEVINADDENPNREDIPICMMASRQATQVQQEKEQAEEATATSTVTESQREEPPAETEDKNQDREAAPSALDETQKAESQPQEEVSAKEQHAEVPTTTEQLHSPNPSNPVPSSDKMEDDKKEELKKESFRTETTSNPKISPHPPPPPPPLPPTSQERRLEEQENEIQQKERTIREQIHAIATRYGMAIHHNERFPAQSRFESPPQRSPAENRFKSEERYHREAHRDYIGYDSSSSNNESHNNNKNRSPTRAQSLSHFPRPPVATTENYNNNNYQPTLSRRLSTVSTNLKGEVAPSIEDALEVSNPYFCDRWSLTPNAQLQVHVQVFQQTRLGQIFDELQVRIGDWELSSVASRTRQETVVMNDDLLSSGESYVFKKGNDKVYFSVKAGRIGSGSVERAVQGLQQIADVEDISVERLIAALPMRLQPANAISRRNSYY